MRYDNVIPWFNYGGCNSGIARTKLVRDYEQPFDALAFLLADIEGSASENQRIIEVFGPRAAVFHGQGDPAYLFRGSLHSFASFALGSGQSILTVLPRYVDPMFPKSGRRKSSILLSGWQGVSEILESAVRRSTNWKNFQTIETDSIADDWGFTQVTYEIWATPREERILVWDDHDAFQAGVASMRQSVPVLLARAEVNLRPQDSGFTIEEVMHLTLYPRFAGTLLPGATYMCNDNWWPDYIKVNVPQTEMLRPILVDMSHKQVLRFQPHDELKLALS